MDALGVDRAHALVLGPGSLFGIACGLELLDRGYEVHLPQALMPPPDLWPLHADRLHTMSTDGGTAAGRRVVRAVLARIPMAVSVLTGDPVDADLADLTLAGMERRAGGRLLVRGDGTALCASKSTVTVLSPSAGEQWLAGTGRRPALTRHPDDDLGDALAVARRAMTALAARRAHVSPGLAARGRAGLGPSSRRR